MITADTKRAEFRDVTLQEYHADLTHDSNSSLRLFEESHHRYFHERVSGRLPHRQPSNEQKLGTNVHMALLEPEKFEAKHVVIPTEVLAKNGAKSTNAYKEWCDQNAGRVQLTQAELDEVRWAVESIRANPKCRELLDNAVANEFPLFWTMDEGYRVKCCIDAVLALDAIVLEVKTSTRGPLDFWKAIREYSYHCQAAIQCDGYEAFYGSQPREFKFIVVNKDGAFESYVSTLRPEAIELGRAQNAATLARLYECKAGRRPWITPGYDEDSPVDLPASSYPVANPYEGV